MLSLHIIGSMAREFNDKGFEFILSLDIPRASYVLEQQTGENPSPLPKTRHPAVARPAGRSAQPRYNRTIATAVPARRRGTILAKTGPMRPDPFH